MIGPRRVIALALVSAALAGCAYLDADAEPLPPVANAPETLTATETSVAGGDVTDASEVSPDEPAVTTTTTTTTTLPPTTTIPPPLGVDELILGPNGIGGALLGADPDTSVSYISSILGAPTDDSGWVDPLEFYLCRGTTVRRVEWGVLSVMFGDESDIATGRTHLISWTYGLIGKVNGKHFHKNSIFNLSILCKKCHDLVTYNKLIIHGYKDTVTGKFLDYEYIQ